MPQSTEQGAQTGVSHSGPGGLPGRDTSGAEKKSNKRDIMDSLLQDTAFTLDKPQVVEGETAVAISGVEYLASYNWTNEPEPTIIVPGARPVSVHSLLFFS